MKKNTIFVCYSSKDRRDIDALITESSKRESIKLWAHHANSPPSASQDEDYITKQIKKSSGAVILVSKKLLESDFINKIELPLIFEQKEKRENYEVSLLLLEDCNYKENSYLNKRVFVNSPTTALNELISKPRQYALVLRDALDIFGNETKEELNSIKSAWGRLKVSFIVTSVILFGVATWFIVGSDSENQEIIATSEVENIELTEEEITVETSIPQTTTVATNVVDSKTETICLGNMYEFWKDQMANFINTPPLVETLDKWKVDCSKLHYAEVFHQIEGNYMSPENFTFDQRIEQAQTLDKECSDSFLAKFGYTVSGPFNNYNIRFVDESKEKLFIFCIAIKETVRNEIWQVKEGLVSDFKINSYKISHSYEEDVKLSEYNKGDCGLFPDWFWVNSDFDTKTSIYDYWIRTDCDSPHHFEVIEIFTYNDTSDLSQEQHLTNVSTKCSASADLYSDLDEVSSTQNKSYYYSAQYLYSWFDGNKFANEPTEIYCLFAWYGEHSFYKVDFSLEYVFQTKKYILENSPTEGTPNISIENCPSEIELPLELPYGQKSPFADPYWFNISWSNLNEPLESFYIYTEDPTNWTNRESIDLSTNLLYSDLSDWSINIPTKWYVAEDHEYGKDKGYLEVGIIFNNGQEITDSCTFDLQLQES